MTIERFGVKFFARKDETIDDTVFIDVFQEWIRLQKLPGILLDVADYRHVPDGPGVMLITHHVNFALDTDNGAFGVLAQRKHGNGDAPLAEKIATLARETLAFAALLEADPRVAGKIAVERGQFHFFSNDRLALPNTDAAFEQLRPILADAGTQIFPDATVTITRLPNDPRERLTAVVSR